MIHRHTLLVPVLALTLIVTASPPLLADAPHDTRWPVTIARQGNFFVDTTPVVQRDGTTRVTNQMHVQYQIPANVGHPYPIVMIHGGGGQATDYLTTPHGRPGWAPLFLQAGCAMYVVDRPAFGRSANGTAYGPLGNSPTAEQIQSSITAIERFGTWPQAKLHTQWPGTGLLGDPYFEQFLASQNPDLPPRSRYCPTTWPSCSTASARQSS
jgi:pimeloyl-ACP methyl ester carboxylesterase